MSDTKKDKPEKPKKDEPTTEGTTAKSFARFALILRAFGFRL